MRAPASILVLLALTAPPLVAAQDGEWGPGRLHVTVCDLQRGADLGGVERLEVRVRAVVGSATEFPLPTLFEHHAARTTVVPGDWSASVLDPASRTIAEGTEEVFVVEVRAPAAVTADVPRAARLTLPLRGYPWTLEADATAPAVLFEIGGADVGGCGTWVVRERSSNLVAPATPAPAPPDGGGAAPAGPFVAPANPPTSGDSPGSAPAPALNEATWGPGRVDLALCDGRDRGLAPGETDVVTFRAAAPLVAVANFTMPHVFAHRSGLVQDPVAPEDDWVVTLQGPALVDIPAGGEVVISFLVRAPPAGSRAPAEASLQFPFSGHPANPWALMEGGPIDVRYRLTGGLGADEDSCTTWTVWEHHASTLGGGAMDGDVAWGRVAAVAAVGTASVATLGYASVAASEDRRYRFLAPVLGLFTRFTKPKVMEHEAREKILAVVRAEPGVHLIAIRDRVGLTTNALVHHLRMLERHRLVQSRREGRYRRFYPVGERMPEPATPALSPLQSRIADAVRARPGVRFADLATELGVPKQTLSYNVKVLESRGIVRLVQRASDKAWVLEPVG